MDLYNLQLNYDELIVVLGAMHDRIDYINAYLSDPDVSFMEKAQPTVTLYRSKNILDKIETLIDSAD